MQKTAAKRGALDITRGIFASLLGIGLIAAVIVLATLFPKRLAEYVNEGLSLAIERVLPTAFPFMVLTSLVEVYSRPALNGFISSLISRLFCIPRSAVGALIIGNVSGFPIGAKLSSEQYSSGAISKETCERLIAYSNTPSPAFVIGVVGGSLFGSGGVGILLFISVILGNLIAARLFKQNKGICQNKEFIVGQSYSFVDSVKSAGSACVNLISFIVIFSVIVGFVKDYIDFTPLKAIIIIFLEVTSATSYITRELTNSTLLSIALTAFSLGFGGISVMAQTAAFTSDTDLSVFPYFKIKLASAISSLFVSIILYLIFGNYLSIK